MKVYSIFRNIVGKGLVTGPVVYSWKHITSAVFRTSFHLFQDCIPQALNLDILFCRLHCRHKLDTRLKGFLYNNYQIAFHFFYI
ncbi:hypothetical protein GDO86_009241 [Hymenochirus boettgeri]|uniref:Uncharacterized protein n=1 Tax=Hymenochirus boettgeri TaxID=247094 RepID=A0A8T2JKB7_9PIPI|nr:hypothetical protein GDO86_009241 [Hymenochirus boettgeri]